MLRNIENTLLHWKDHPLRTPLIVRGARQVGKTYAIQSFGRREFSELITINFESNPRYQDCFKEMDPGFILAQLELVERQKIIPGKTLLFLDEIQQCPQALKSLRYFKEKLPELHVIAAGSLLEFAIRDENFSFPVGRVQFARMYPLSFEEYLDACGDTVLRQTLQKIDCTSLPNAVVHNVLMERMREYFIVGGMPAAVLAHLKTRSLLEVKYVQRSLLDAFESDFGKYAAKSQHRNLKKVFEEVPRLIGDHVKYSRIDSELPNPARDIKLAIELLHLAGLLHFISASSAGTVPLLSGLREAVFKLIFLDIGLVQEVMKVDPAFPGLMTGPLAEQFVGQELIASSDPYLDSRLFFWSREKGTAEVDYLITHKGVVYPIEVKAGKAGKLKSLHLFIEEKKAPFGIKISQDPLNWSKGILSVPFYLTSHLSRLIESVKSS